MTDTERITALNAGRMLSRYGWIDKRKFIFLAKHFIPKNVQAYAGFFTDMYDVVLLYNNGNALKQYHGGNDYLADDWYIIDEIHQ